MKQKLTLSGFDPMTYAHVVSTLCCHRGKAHYYVVFLLFYMKALRMVYVAVIRYLFYFN
jgi:hypothetical protein